MKIIFQDVLPKPLQSMSHDSSSIWSSNTTLLEGTKIQVTARSGRGKSTLISLLYGIRNDYEGVILFDNNPIKEFSVKDWCSIRREKISIVFQDLQLFPNLTVFENIQLKNEICSTFTHTQLYEMLERVGLKEKTNVICGQLSIGQQQRVAILRALCQPFSWILLDEPFSHLDRETSKDCFTLIQEVCEIQRAGILITSLGDDIDFSMEREIYI
jgi:ABC-type lipoprotein export system ATPase subunit